MSLAIKEKQKNENNVYRKRSKSEELFDELNETQKV